MSQRNRRVRSSRGTLEQRSPPQQIEHWARIGFIMESVLDVPVRQQVKRASLREETERALTDASSPAGIRRSRAVIARTSDEIIADDD